MKKISISSANSKMGAVPSVSLPPVVTCAAGCACAKKCYAAKLCRLRPAVAAAYQRNLDVLNSDPDAYFSEIRDAAAMVRFFRWHVSGDIVSLEYLRRMAEIAAELPHTEFLAFTKRYDIVNAYAAVAGIPSNLHIIFSAWPGMPMPNPHRFPVAQVVFRGQEPDPSWKVCGGNCANCACRGVGCWALKSDETICFGEH